MTRTRPNRAARREGLQRSAPTTDSYLLKLPPTPRVKKGCGQRKNRRDAAGRKLHRLIIKYGPGYSLRLAA